VTMAPAFDSVVPGAQLPPLTLTITPSMIVAGALASGDFEAVHHDRSAARARATPDIFMNILTTNGYLQRFVNDWTGPQGRIRSVDIRLGVPTFAGDTLKLSGVVRTKQRVGSEGIVEIAVRGTNRLGEHLAATVRVALP
jgi:acyl dehydratase